MRITTREWAQLSAYLDNELSPRERRKIEARLKTRPELQATLENLRKTKMVLAEAPRLALPRSFTLTPQMVGLSRRRSPAQGYRLAAAALSFLFIALVVVDVSRGALRGAVPAELAPRSEEMMIKSAPEEEEVGEAWDAMEEPSLLEAAEAPAAEGEAEETEELAPEAEAELAAGAPAESESVQEESQADQAAGAAESELDRSGDGQEEVGAEDLEAQAQPAPTTGQNAEDRGVIGAEDDAGLPPPSRINWLRLAEIILGLAAIGSFAAAWIKRKRLS